MKKKQKKTIKPSERIKELAEEIYETMYGTTPSQISGINFLSLNPNDISIFAIIRYLDEAYEKKRTRKQIKKQKKIKAWKIELRCRGCGKLINETKEIKDKELAEKIYYDALINPLLGWCQKCDRKPFPKIIEIYDQNPTKKTK